MNKKTALEIIAKAKRKKNIHTKQVQDALDELSRLDDLPIIPNYAQSKYIRTKCEQEQEAGHKHFNVDGAGITLDGKFVPIQQPD